MGVGIDNVFRSISTRLGNCQVKGSGAPPDGYELPLVIFLLEQSQALDLVDNAALRRRPHLHSVIVIAPDTTGPKVSRSNIKSSKTIVPT